MEFKKKKGKKIYIYICVLVWLVKDGTLDPSSSIGVQMMAKGQGPESGTSKLPVAAMRKSLHPPLKAQETDSGMALAKPRIPSLWGL